MYIRHITDLSYFLLFYIFYCTEYIFYKYEANTFLTEQNLKKKREKETEKYEKVF